MCGLFGMAVPQVNGFEAKEMEALVSNMNINMFRGSDSTGIVVANVDGDFNFLKVVGGPGSLVDSPKWATLRADIYKEGKIVSGHGRAATRGKVTIKNAHPFQIFKDAADHSKGNIILAHNGTLQAHQQLPGFDEHDVDSEWMAKKIVELGPMEALGKIYGAIATVWFDSNERAFFFYRNTERPLSFVRSTSGVMYWNSELAALMWLKHRYFLQYEVADIVSFKPNFLYKLNCEKIGEFEEVKEVPRIYPTYVPNRTNWASQRALLEDTYEDWGGYTPEWKRNEVLQRSYEDDIKHVFSRKITSVEWADGKRITRFGTKTNGYTSSEVQPPYLPGLQAIEFDEAAGDVTVTRDGHLTHVEPKTVAHNVVPIRPRSGMDLAAPVPKGIQNGGKFSFMQDGVRHKCRLDKGSSFCLATYGNPLDGPISIGETVYIESIPGDSTRIGFDNYRVIGTRIKDLKTMESQVDSYIEWYYYSPGAMGQQVGVFKAEIQLIALTDVEEFNVSRCYVKVLLANIQKVAEVADVGNVVDGIVVAKESQAVVVNINNEVQ